MDAWVLWVVLAGALGVGEMLSGGFFLAPFALGALVGAAGDAVAGTAVGIVMFVVASMLALGVLRPVVRRHLTQGPTLRTGGAALVGKQAIVLERIANHEGVGAVRIDGEVWTARSLDDDHEIKPGTRVDVVEIKGATALVIE